MPMPPWPARKRTLPRHWNTSNGGRRAAEAKKLSSASWDLLELSFRFAARDGQQAMRLIEHLQNHHLNEPGVGEALTRLLMDVGLLRPDGTPAYAPGESEPAMAAAEEPAVEPGGLWTPDSASRAAAAESSGRRNSRVGPLSLWERVRVRACGGRPSRVPGWSVEKLPFVTSLRRSKPARVTLVRPHPDNPISSTLSGEPDHDR